MSQQSPSNITSEVAAPGRYQQAKKSWRRQKAFRSSIRSGIFMLLGILSAGFGLRGFLMPNHFIDGGVTGISLLLNAKTGFPVPVMIILINIPFILLDGGK